MKRAWIALGSNLQDPAHQLAKAVAALQRHPQCQLVASSPVYRSDPMGPQDQPAFLNAVVALDTALEPLPLLDALQAIENQQGRTREQRWGPRTLDLDMLLYEQQQLQHHRLTLPHPGLTERNFVLYPLLDIAGAGLRMPTGEELGTLVAACSRSGLHPTDIRLDRDPATAQEVTS